MRTKLMSTGAVAGLALGLTIDLPANVDMGSQQQGTPLQGVHPAQYGTPAERGRPLSPTSEREMREARLRAQEQVVYGAPERREAELHEFSHFEGMRVENRRSESLGTVEDFVMDMDNGRVEFVAVKADADRAPDGELRLVPPSTLQLSGDTLQLDISQRRWDDAPTVYPNEIARFQDEQEAREIYRYYEEDFRTRIWGARQGDRERELPNASDIPRHRGGQPQAQPWGPDETAAPRQQSRAIGTRGAPGAEFGDRSEVEWADRAEAREPREYGAPARDARRAEDGPRLRNPRLHQSSRGTPQGEPVAVFGERSPEREFRAREHQDLEQELRAEGSADREYGAREGRARPEQRGERQERRHTQARGELQRASELIGQEVLDEQNEQLGEVSDFLIDLQGRQVPYVIISTDQVDEAGHFAIPSRELRTERETRLSVATTAEELREAPEYDRRTSLREQRIFRYGPAGDREFAAPPQRGDPETEMRRPTREPQSEDRRPTRQPQTDDDRPELEEQQRPDEEREFGAPPERQEDRNLRDEEDTTGDDRLEQDELRGQDDPQGQERGQEGTARGQEMN